MNTISKPWQGLVRPFNLNQDEYENMFEGPIPTEVCMFTGIKIVSDDTSGTTRALLEKLHDPFVELISGCLNESDQWGIKVYKKLGRLISVDEFPMTRLANRIDELWSANDLTVNVVFYDMTTEIFFLPHTGTLYAMDFWDLLVYESESIDPVNHNPIPATSPLDVGYHLAVHDLFLERVSIWNRKLVDYRNMVMVKARALILDRDPDSEYAKFKHSGGKHHLEYPIICP